MQRPSLISSTFSLAFTCKHFSIARWTCRTYSPPQLGILRFSWFRLCLYFRQTQVSMAIGNGSFFFPLQHLALWCVSSASSDFLFHWPLLPVSGYDWHVRRPVHVDTYNPLNITQDCLPQRRNVCMRSHLSFFNHLHVHTESWTVSPYIFSTRYLALVSFYPLSELIVIVYG